jgi:hypothetical protein
MQPRLLRHQANALLMRRLQRSARMRRAGRRDSSDRALIVRAAALMLFRFARDQRRDVAEICVVVRVVPNGNELASISAAFLLDECT